MDFRFLDDAAWAARGDARGSVWRDLGEVVTGEGEASAPRTLTLLVVHDDPDQAGRIISGLVEAGHQVVGPASSVAVAARLAGLYPIDVALIGGQAVADARAEGFARRLRQTWPIRALRLGGLDGRGDWDGVIPEPCALPDIMRALSALDQTSLDQESPAGGRMVGDVGLEPTTR